MHSSKIAMASLLAMSVLVGAPTAFARTAGAYQPSVTISAAPPVVDTGSEAYPNSPTGVGAGGVTVSAAPPVVDTGSQAYPSSPTGADSGTSHGE